MFHSLSFSCACSFFFFCSLVHCLPSLSLTLTHTHARPHTHTHTRTSLLARCLFRSRRYSLQTNFHVNNHSASLWKRARCQSHFFNRLRLYTESIKLKYLCNGSSFVRRHSLSMNIITVTGLVHAHNSPTLNELNRARTCEKVLLKWFARALDRRFYLLGVFVIRDGFCQIS